MTLRRALRHRRPTSRVVRAIDSTAVRRESAARGQSLLPGPARYVFRRRAFSCKRLRSILTIEGEDRELLAQRLLFIFRSDR